jgi:hypothetical protein
MTQQEEIVVKRMISLVAVAVVLFATTSATAQTTKTKNVGSFMVATVTDQMTDKKQTTVMSVGSKNELGLAWTCRADGTLLVFVKGQASSLTAEVQYRFGQQQPVTGRDREGRLTWERGSGKATLAGAAAEAFTTEAQQHPSVVMRLSPFSGDSVTDTIPLRSLDQALLLLPCRRKSK